MANIILAFDPGQKKTGVALGNTLTKEARPLTIVRGSMIEQIKEIKKLCEKWSPDLAIVGTPNKAEAKDAFSYSLDFEKLLVAETGIATKLYREDYTTVVARINNSKKEVDDEAACILANDWLNQKDLVY